MKLDYKFTAQDLISRGRTTLEDIDAIKSWLKIAEDNYVPPNLQDEIIAIFLICCNNDIDLAKKTIITFYKCKKNGPELYDDRDYDRKDVQKALDTVQMSVFPQRTDENYAIHYFRVIDPNYNNFDLVPIMKVSYMLVDISHQRDPPHGLIVLIDMKEFGLMHLTKLRLGAVKKYFTFLQDGFPLHMIAIHIINGGYLIHKVLSLIKSFMKGELISMIHVHQTSSSEELLKVLPKKCLPKDYGGDLPSCEQLNETTREQFRELQHFWSVEEKMRKEWRK